MTVTALVVTEMGGYSYTMDTATEVIDTGYNFKTVTAV